MWDEFDDCGGRIDCRGFVARLLRSIELFPLGLDGSECPRALRIKLKPRQYLRRRCKSVQGGVRVSSGFEGRNGDFEWNCLLMDIGAINGREVKR